MIPEIWYELLRFIGRYSEDFAWYLYDQRPTGPKVWCYCALGEWSVPHQARKPIARLLVVDEVALIYTHDEVAMIYFQEAILRSGYERAL